ncbi:hypothetical protein DPEC_G00351680 [Dallia pectoralis]|uniref:Uncharacterized protein n=1 Tax=Dallia pectoralis TaxID=75939 RepID=A0ACC2F236_DALPE|nr:hypothetical protein DPEC_G00351680 [Dallia pectoralis]
MPSLPDLRFISSSLPRRASHGGAFCPRGSSDGGQYVPKLELKRGARGVGAPRIAPRDTFRLGKSILVGKATRASARRRDDDDAGQLRRDRGHEIERGAAGLRLVDSLLLTTGAVVVVGTRP